MNKLAILILALALLQVTYSNAQENRKFRAGRSGCNPPCRNGGSCTRVRSGSSVSFKCNCLLGTSGQVCSKLVNFCVTQSDGKTPAKTPCNSDPAVSSCAPTVLNDDGSITSIANQANLGDNTFQTLAGYACFQTDQVGTCRVTAADAPAVFTYTCTTRDNNAYVYGY